MLQFIYHVLNKKKKEHDLNCNFKLYSLQIEEFKPVDKYNISDTYKTEDFQMFISYFMFYSQCCASYADRNL